MESGTLPLYSLVVFVVLGRVTNGQVELSSTLNGGSSCPNQPVTLQCKAYNSILQSWVFPPFITDFNPVTFDSTRLIGDPVDRSDGGLMIEGTAIEITQVSNGVAHITSTLSFPATSAVNGKTAVCISDTGPLKINDSLTIQVTDSVVLPVGFSCTSTAESAVNCEQSVMQYQCSWSRVIDTFNFTVYDGNDVIVQEMMFQTGDNGTSVEFSVTCNSFATVMVKAFRTCNSSTQLLTDNRTLSAAVCDEVCPGSTGLSAGAIAGIVIGILVMVIIIIVIVVTPITVYVMKRGDKSVEMFLFLIKPDVANTSRVDDIISTLKDNGIVIVKKVKRKMTKDEVQKLYGHLSSNKNYDYEALEKFMLSGPCVLLAVRSSSGGDFTAKQRTIAEVLEATGALKERIREQFGKDLIENAVHASDSPDGAQRELQIVFHGKYVTF